MFSLVHDNDRKINTLKLTRQITSVHRCLALKVLYKTSQHKRVIVINPILNLKVNILKPFDSIKTFERAKSLDAGKTTMGIYLNIFFCCLLIMWCPVYEKALYISFLYYYAWLLCRFELCTY